MNQKWTTDRWLSLFSAVLLLPIPVSLLRSAGRRLTPAHDESSLSIAMLALGAQIAVIPIGFGLLETFWEAPAFPVGNVASGLAQVVVGLVAFAGLYISRISLSAGLILSALATVGMAFLASWALPGIVVGGALLVVFSAVRAYAPPPMTGESSQPA